MPAGDNPQKAVVSGNSSINDCRSDVQMHREETD